MHHLNHDYIANLWFANMLEFEFICLGVGKSAKYHPLSP